MATKIKQPTVFKIEDHVNDWVKEKFKKNAKALLDAADCTYYYLFNNG